MKKLWTQAEVCERLRIKYGKLNKLMNSGDFVPPVYGRGKKLVFDPDAVEAWIKNRQSPVIPAVSISTPTQQRRKAKAFRERQEAADATLKRHSVSRKGDSE